MGRNKSLVGRWLKETEQLKAPAAVRAWQQAHPDKMREYRDRWEAAHREEMLAAKRKWWREKRFGGRRYGSRENYVRIMRETGGRGY